MSEETNQTISAANYRKIFKEQYKLVSLPSDLDAKVKIRKLKLMDFLAQVIVPLNIFTEDDLKSVDSKTSLEDKEDATRKAINADPETSIKMMRHMIVASVVEPKIVFENPKDDELCVDELDDLDKAVLMNEIVVFNGYDKMFRDRVRPFRAK